MESIEKGVSMSGVVRFVALDEKHDPDLGYPVLPEAAPERVQEPVWGVWEQVPDDSEDGFHSIPVSGGLTADQAEDSV
jgi:hypothetical protein